MTEKIWTHKEFDKLPKEKQTGCFKFGDDYEEWYKEGALHREDGPAIKFHDGTYEWYKDGKFHRLDGPALIHPNGVKIWYKEGKRHRLDGPASEFPNGHKLWFIEGKALCEREFKIKSFVILHGLEKFL